MLQAACYTVCAVDLGDEPPGQQHASASVTLGESSSELEQTLPGTGSWRDRRGEPPGEQERRLLEPQASGDQDLGEERVACAVMVAGAGPLAAVDREAAQPNAAANSTKRTSVRLAARS